MLKEPTLEKLQALRLIAMAAAWDDQRRHPDVQAMPFDERFALSCLPSNVTSPKPWLLMEESSNVQANSSSSQR